MVARCKAWVCGHSLAGIVGSYPAGDMNVSLLYECGNLSGTFLCDGSIPRSAES